MNENIKRSLNGFAKKAAVISGVFTLFVMLLMFADRIRAKEAFESTEPKLEQMRAKITQTPNDESLKSDFAALELVYRRAYFVNEKQSQTGSALLLAGVGIFLAMCAVILQTANKTPAIPVKDSVRERSISDRFFRRALLGIAAIAAVGASVYFLIPSRKNQEPPKPSYADIAELDANWTSLRGSRNDGISRSVSIPADSKLEEVWKAEVPSQGFNSPVAFGDKVFISGADAQARSIFCYSQTDGSPLWRVDVKTSSKSNYDDQSGPAPSTMSTDGRRVYAIFPTGELVCASVDGKLLYVKTFGTPEILYAYASSLLICGKELVVQMYLEKTRSLYVLDSANGREIWRVEDGADTSWSSPSLVLHDGKKIIVVSSCSGLEGYDLETGARLWRQNCLSGEVAASITSADGKIFAANDGAAALAINIKDGGVVWRNDSLILPSVASPVYADGELYLFSSGGTVSRINAENGELIREYDSDDGFYSSPIAAGESIIAFNNSGGMRLMKIGDGFKLGEPTRNFDEAVYATPAFANSMMFIRVGSSLHAFKIILKDQ